MTRLVWLLVLGALVPCTAAQTARIVGTVRDAAGHPLAGAHVRIDGTARGAATDPAGRYVLDRLAPGVYVVRASRVGYGARAVTVTLEDRAQVDFVLPASPVEAGSVVVTASRTARPLDRVAQSLAVVTPHEIEARGAVTLDAVLRHVPGVQLADNQVSIRGSSGFSYNVGSRVLLLVDGLPMLGPDSEGVPFEVIPMDQVEQIEVVKGPGSALYGGGALGGVIGVRTKAFPERASTAVRVQAGAYLPVRHAAWRAGWDEAGRPRPYHALDLSHARRLSERAGFWVSTAYRRDAGYLRRAASERLRAYGKLGYALTPTLRLAVLGGVTRSRGDSFLYWNGLADPLNPGTISLGGGTTTGSEDHLTYRFSLLPQLTHAVSARLSYRVAARFFGVWLRPLDDAGVPRPSIRGTLGLRYGGEVQATWAPPQGTLTAGALVDANAVRSSYFGAEPPFLSQPEGAVFAQWTMPLAPRLDATVGLRYDFYLLESDDVEQQLSPTLGATYRLSEAWHLRASAGTGFRVPGVTERYVDDSSLFPLLANPALHPETSAGAEVGVRGAAGPLRLDGALFWTNFRRLVEPTFVSNAGRQGFQFVNLTRARIRGLEARADAALFGDRGAARLAYQLLDARDLTVDRPLVFRSRHLVQAGLDARVGRFTLGADARYASAPARVDSDFARFVPDADVLVDTRVVDLRAGAAWQAVTLTLFARNAFDHYYAERPAVLAAPRSLAVELRARF